MITYSAAYNVVSLVLWTLSLVSVLLKCDLQDSRRIAQCAQAFNLLDIVHALFGVTKSAVTPSLMQAASRILSLTLTHSTAAPHTVIKWMISAWSIADAVRFAYYLRPTVMQWLRYNLFIVLYPVGFVCELLVIYYHTKLADQRIKYGLVTAWIGGFYFMYAHMFRQRSKLTRAKLK